MIARRLYRRLRGEVDVNTLLFLLPVEGGCGWIHCRGLFRQSVASVPISTTDGWRLRKCVSPRKSN